MVFESLKPKLRPDAIKVKGRLYYCVSDRSNTLIRLKRPIREEFSDLNGKDSLISYKMEYYKDSEEFRKRINELIKKGEIPFLLNLYKDGKG